MSGPIVRTGTTPEFWKNWDRVFGKKETSSTESSTKSKAKAKSGKASGKPAAKKTASKKKK